MNTQQTGSIPASKLSEEENTLIRQTFFGNEALLKNVRAVFFGLGLSDGEKEQIKATFQNQELMAIMRKRFLPSLSKDTAIGQVQDIWLGVEQQVFAQSPDAIEQAIQYKQQAVEMTEHGLALLQDPNGTQLVLAYRAYNGPRASNPDPLGIGLLARNQFIRHVEGQLTFLWIIANQIIEKVTPAQAAKKAMKDSAR